MGQKNWKNMLLFQVPSDWLQRQNAVPLIGKMEIVADNIEKDAKGVEWRHLDTKDILSDEARAELRADRWELVVINLLLDDGNRRHAMFRK
jgi:hypothetical protein